MEEPLKLLLRLRPPNTKGRQYWAESGRSSVIGENDEQFHADNVFSTPSTNYEIFSSSVTQQVEKACAGYNTAILAYGQSGAGKTHTLLGSANEDGILAYMIQFLFNIIEEEQKSSGRTFLVQLQIMELYCERVRDLLTDNSASTEPQIFEKNDIPRIINIHEVPVTSADQALELIKIAQSRRVVASTDLNDQSSRSHAIIQLTIESSLTVAGKSNLRSRKSIMSIVDLAGSENAAANTGQRAKEGANINKSLFTLTKVINALTDKNPQHIPYRDSKLTRLLKPCIGGNSTTLIICCVDPQNKEESLRTLKFSERLKLVKGRVTINEDEEGGQLNKYLDEIERLNKELTDMKQRVKEDEMQEKTKRLDELRAQIIGGSSIVKPAQTRAPRRQTICAPGMRAFPAFSLFTPPVKRTITFLPGAIDESPTKDKKESTDVFPISQSTRSSETVTLEQEYPLTADDLDELEDLRILKFENEMKIRELNSEVESLKASNGNEIGQLQKIIDDLNKTNLKLQENLKETNQKDFETYNFMEKLYTAISENERLKKEFAVVIEHRDRLEIELTMEKAVNDVCLNEFNDDRMKLMDQLLLKEHNFEEVQNKITEAVSIRLDLNKEKILQLENQLSRAQQINTEMQKEHDYVEMVDQRRKEAENKLKDAAEIIANNAAIIEQMRAERETMACKDEEIKKLKTELAKSKQALSSKTSALDHSLVKNQDLVMEIRHLTTNQKQLEQQLLDIEKDQKLKEEGLKNQIIFKNREHEENNSKLLERIASLEEKLRRMDILNRDKSLENLRLLGNISALQKEVKQYRTNEDMLHEIIQAKTASLTEENKKLHDSLSCAQNQVAEYCSTIAALEADMNQKNMFLEKAIQEANHLKSSSQMESSYKGQMETLQRENLRLKRELKDIEDELIINKENIAKKKNQDNDSEIDNLKRKNCDLADKLEAKNNTLNRGIETYKKLVEEHEQLRNKYDDVKIKFNRLREKYIVLKKKNCDN